MYWITEVGIMVKPKIMELLRMSLSKSSEISSEILLSDKSKMRSGTTIMNKLRIILWLYLVELKSSFNPSIFIDFLYR